MEFEEGNKVEVCRRKDLVFGSWWTAKIISKYGHTYCVRYEKLVNSDGDRIVDAVNYEDLRPLCTHNLGNNQNSMVGDMVEISDPLCWRVGEIVQILSRDWYLVKFGSSDKGTKIHKTCVHIPQVWDGIKWSSVVKGNGIKTSDGRVIRTREIFSLGARIFHVNEDGSGDKFFCRSDNASRNPKRTPYHLPESFPDASSARAPHNRKKRNTTEKSGACAGPLSRMLPSLPGKMCSCTGDCWTSKSSKHGRNRGPCCICLSTFGNSRCNDGLYLPLLPFSKIK